MKSLVTGGAGFIGSNLVDALLELGHEVIVIDNESSDAHEEPYWNDEADNYVRDICDYVNTRELYDDVDYVFHLAAEARIPPTIINPVGATLVNTLGTNVVLQCAREAGVKRVMYSSTSAAYGMNPLPNVETQPDDCLNPYSVSKVNGEKLCTMYTDLFGLPTIIFRYFNVYGERQPTKGQYAPAVGLFLRQHANGESITITGDGNQRRDFVHVSDVVNANILAATTSTNVKNFGQVFNVGTGLNHSVNEIVSMISNNFVFIDARPGEARETLSNAQKIKNAFGWYATVSIASWIKRQSLSQGRG